jgi:hypothetical protein
MFNTMNLQDTQQYVPSAGDNDDVIHIGHIDIESIQSDVDSIIKELSEELKASIPFSCYIINKNDKPCTSPFGNTLSKIDICDYLGGQMYPAARLAFFPNTYKPPSSNDEMTSKILSHATDGQICGEICPLLPMMQAIQLYPMDLNNPLKETRTIVCFDVEYFIKALEHLLWNCLIFLNINVRLW